MHLDGSLRLSTLIDLAIEHNVDLPYYTEKELRKHVYKDYYSSLEEYLRGFQYTVAVMRTPEGIERIAYEFAVDSFKDNVFYFECRFAPQLFAKVGGLSSVDVVEAVNRGFEKAAAEFNRQDDVVSGRRPPYKYGIILCALRFFNEHMSPYYASLMNLFESDDKKKNIYGLASEALVRDALKLRDQMNIPVVGVDIAGGEAHFPTKSHFKAFSIAHKHLLNRTIHGGEAWGPTSIYQAICFTHADRLGHGTHIFDVDAVEDPLNEDISIRDPQQLVQRLLHTVKDRGLCLEVCLTSNEQTHPHLRGSIASHPLRRMLDYELPVSLNTDNRLMSNTTLVKEMIIAANTFDFSQEDTKRVVLQAFDSSFFPGTVEEKTAYVKQVKKYYDEVEKSYEETVSRRS